MADYGMKIWGSHGFVQIDGTYRNLGLRAKGSVFSGGVSSETGWFYAIVTLPADAPVLAWRSTAPTVQQVISQVGNQITYYFQCQGSGVRVDYWLFDYPNLALLPGNYGLRVWNVAGDVVFDSRAKYMRVIDTLITQNAQTVDPIQTGISRAYSVGNIAVVQSILRYSMPVEAIEVGVPNPRMMQFLRAAVVRFDGPAALSFYEAVVNSVIYEGQGNLIPTPQWQDNYGYMVLDVSNF
ncbi:hypothetical protein [Cupriavidus plantarum]|uniref:hypothetical protein n=1 Tax=Cupriavidus plantarum TaxID=942865 RepID=UPI000EAE092F|nr:hypothetical protein [Cupriavidus plantarum]RLK45936.1 hypothetical protein C7417_1966 [Cupriavidus plantarum]